MGEQKSVVRGILAGMAGGLVAAWVMNEFMVGPGQQAHSSEGTEDATMKAAEAIVRREEENGGPTMDYAFGALAGGFYGALAEYSSTVTSGFGTGFGGALFRTADSLAVPVLNPAPSPSDQPVSAQASPFAAHIVFGVTTEFVRRILRSLL